MGQRDTEHRYGAVGAGGPVEAIGIRQYGKGAQIGRHRLGGRKAPGGDQPVVRQLPLQELQEPAAGAVQYQDNVRPVRQAS